MIIPSYNNLTTTKSLKNTVLCDDQVFSWLAHLIEHDPVRSRVSADSAMSKVWGRIRKIRIWRVVLAATLAFTALAFFLYRDPLLLIPGLPIIFLRMNAIRRERTCLGDLFILIVQADFPEERLSKTTLYQIGEFYSRKHGGPSLVDTIVSWGNLFHYIITFGFILPILLLSLDIRQCAFLLICAVLLPQLLIHTGLFYKWLVK
jgi:hypothetical protein